LQLKPNHNRASGLRTLPDFEAQAGQPDFVVPVRMARPGWQAGNLFVYRLLRPAMAGLAMTTILLVFNGYLKVLLDN
jgi:hypothetical protein